MFVRWYDRRADRLCKCATFIHISVTVRSSRLIDSVELDVKMRKSREMTTSPYAIIFRMYVTVLKFNDLTKRHNEMKKKKRKKL